MAGKTYIKTSSNSWDRIKKIYIKTGGQTWTAVRKAYIKTSTGAWKKVYDTASNKPYLKNGDYPRIRLNSFRSAGYIEAPPVQMMGPSTGYSNGWPLGAIGTYLYGANADDLANYVSGNGSNITYTYNWYYNLTGNQNDDIEWNGSVNSGSDRDLFQNNSTYLGASNGDYWDRNFITFKVNATNSAGTFSASSPQLYVVRQQPTGTVTMVDSAIATINQTMSATFTYSYNWYNTTDLAESYIEWFAVDNLGDTLTTSNRVQIELLSTFTATGTTTKSATTFHTPTLQNKYYYARLTLNNSNTLPAKFNGNVISISGFTPNSAVTSQANKTSKTATANGPFNLTNAIKTARSYDSVSARYKRYVSVDIGQSTGATQYEVQIEGQYSGELGVYNFSSASWVVLQSLSIAPYVYESSRIGGVLTMPAVWAANYYNYRFTARSRNGTSLSGAAYSNGGTLASPQYVTAPAVAPSAPVISNIATSSDSFGSYVTFNNYVASFGSNEWDYYTYSIDNGVTFNQLPAGSFVNNTEGKIYVTAGSAVSIRIKLTNIDGATSAQSNLLSIVAAVIPSSPTSVVVKSFNLNQGTIFFTSGTNTKSVQAFLSFDDFSQFDSIDNYVNVASSTSAKIQLNGASSSTREYAAVLRPYSGDNKTGGSGSTTIYAYKTLNGSDKMTVNTGTPTVSNQRTLTFPWVLATGSPSFYTIKLYNYTTGTLLATKTAGPTAVSTSFNETNGVTYSGVYYATIMPYYQYATGVIYEDLIFATSNITAGSNLSAPTSTSISSMSRLNDTTVRAQIGSAGGSGPYYQLYWASSANPPTTATYDAAGTTSTVTEDFSFGNGITYYFYMRSSSENLGNTITTGSATAGTYSDYGPLTGAASYTFAQPSGTVSISPLSGTAGTTQFTATPSISSAPTSQISYQWQYYENSTLGFAAVPGATSSTYTPPSNFVTFYGSTLRCQIVANNGVGTSLTTQSGNATVSVPATLPSNTSTPTLTPTSIAVGTVLTAGIGTWSGTTPITYDLRIYRGTANVNTTETLVKSAGNVTSTTYTVTQADYDSNQLYFRTFVNATNTAGSSGFVGGQERGPIATPVLVPVNSTIPTLTGNLTVGSVLTFGVGTWTNSPTSYDLRLYRGTAGVATSETLAKNAGNVTSSTYTITQADLNSNQLYFRAFATASNAGGTSNSGVYTAGQERGPITAAAVTAPSGGSVTLSGTASIGSTLTASTSGWTGSPTSYDTRIVRGTAGVIIGETLKSSSTTSSTSYVVQSADAGYYFKGFASATNSGGTSAFAASAEKGPVPSAPAVPAPVLSTLTGNNSLQFGGTFSWSYTNSPTGYSILVQGPTGTVFTTNNAYSYTGTSFRPGYDGTGWQGSGSYTIYVSATNAGGSSVVSSLTQSMS